MRLLLTLCAGALLTTLVTDFAFSQPGTCGSPPIVEDGTVKGEIDSKASFLRTFVGDAALKGQVEIAKNDVLQRYPNADELRLRQYFLYVLCLQIMSDTKLGLAEKVKLFKETSETVFPPKTQKQPGIVRQVQNAFLDRNNPTWTFQAPAGAIIDAVGLNCPAYVRAGNYAYTIAGDRRVPVPGYDGETVLVTIELRGQPNNSGGSLQAGGCHGKFLVTAAD